MRKSCVRSRYTTRAGRDLTEGNAVPGAIGYAVFARHNDGAATLLGETSATELQVSTTTAARGATQW